MIWVKDRSGERITKDGGRFGKSNAMLAPIRRFLSWIPLKSESQHRSLSLAKRWRTVTKPCSCKARQTSRPERTRSLPNRNLDLGYEHFAMRAALIPNASRHAAITTK